MATGRSISMKLGKPRNGLKTCIIAVATSLLVTGAVIYVWSSSVSRISLYFDIREAPANMKCP
ncbi:MAG: hypothetical protein V1897_12295, partial [Pseudomonadota bacterium]